MPNKLRVLIGLIAVGMLGSLWNGIGGSTAGWLSLVLNAFLLLGLVKGKEGARTFLMLLAGIGVLVGVFGVVIFAIAASVAHSSRSDLMALAAIGATSLLVLAQNAFALWCLSRRDVQQWMFRKSLGAMGEDAAKV